MKLPNQGGFEPEPQMPPMPPVDDQMPMDGEGGADEMNPMPDDMGGTPEGDDPKKKIQQKAGKISKELADYQGDDKEELAKYVKGMVDKCADKIIDGDDEDEMPEDGQIPQDVTTETQMESVDHTERIVNEIVNELISDRGERHTGRDEKKVTNKGISKDNPFVSKR